MRPKTLFSTTLIAASLLLTTTAHAAEVLKTVENGKNVVYVRGVTANGPVQLIQSGGQSISAKLANSCGVVKLTQPSGGWSGNITVNGTTVDPTTLTVPSTIPTCTGGQLQPTQTTNYKDALGNVYLVGLTANQAATVGLPSTGTRSATANGCGFAKFTEPSSAPWTSTSQFTISGSSYTLSTITAQNYPPYCRNVGTSAAPMYVEYVAK